MKEIIHNINNYLRPILHSYSEILFLRHYVIGLLLFALTFINPQQGTAGLIAIISAFGFAKFLGFQQEFLRFGYYTYNALLVGLSIGNLFAISWVSIGFIAITAILTFVVTLSLTNIFERLFGLPVLSIPFVLVSSLIYLAAGHYSNIYIEHFTPHPETFIVFADVLPTWVPGFFKCLGAILFMPQVLAGLCIFLLLLFCSRILAVLAVMGYLVGATIQGTFIGSFEEAYRDAAGFNYILIAMALGGIFNIPSLRSYLLAMVGVALATVFTKSMDVFWSQFGIPVFTLPFNIITLSMIYMLASLNYPLRPVIYKSNPERTLEYFFASRLRYAHNTTLYLPFIDAWTVWQGFNGQWTHQGLWQYAYDFIKTDAEGKTYSGEGKLLADYYAFQKYVCSPVRGYVVFTAATFADNPIGSVDKLNNWGNYVIIHDERGFFVSLCHLSQYHVYVKAGDWVEPYQIIGLSGNSGYSPQPHLHMQYHVNSYLNSATLPFCFASVLSQGINHAHVLPAEKQVVCPAFSHRYYHQVTNFTLDQQLTYQVTYRGNIIKVVTFTTKMALDGTFYLAHNNSRLYLGQTATCFYFYHLEGDDLYLRLLYQALPSMPLNYNPEHVWEDYVPLNFITHPLKRLLAQLYLSVQGEHLTKNAIYHFSQDDTIVGCIQSRFDKHPIQTQLTLDPFVKFSAFTVGYYQFSIRR
jgi:urea transporter